MIIQIRRIKEREGETITTITTITISTTTTTKEEGATKS